MKKLSPISYLVFCISPQKSSNFYFWTKKAIAIELSIYFSFIQESVDLYYYSALWRFSKGTIFWVWWGSRNPMYPLSYSKNKWAFFGVPPKILKKYWLFISCVTHFRYSGCGSSNPILAMTRISKFCRSVDISDLNMQLSLQSETL